MRESFVCDFEMLRAVDTDSPEDVGGGAEVRGEPLPSISIMGLTEATMPGSFAISSGFDKKADRISPAPPDVESDWEKLAADGAPDAVNFFNISESISSCEGSFV